MAREILLEGDHRRKIFYEKDPVTGLIGVRVNYNNDMHLAPTAERRKDTPGGFKTTKENAGMHLMAHIPDSVVLLELVPRGICRPGGSVIDYPALHKWLDLSDNKVFRVNQGRMS